MLQIRPTFSESWYRVAGLKAKLRSSTQISRQHYRGERWYVVRDPAGNQFHRLSDAAYRFVGLLDGTRTVEEAWDLVGGQLADDAPTQPEVIHILSQLHGANLLEADVTPDSAVLLRRHKQQRKQQWQQRAMNMLFPRIPLWDPDRFLKRWMPVAEVVLSKLGAIVWLIVVASAIFLLVPEWPRLRASASDAIAPGNWPFLWATFVLIKLIHELGHAFICRRFGGEVHELGIMFLVLIPAPYVDASTAWAFPQAWKRILVGAGGMISELFFAAIMAFVWRYTAPGELINQLAYNAMLIASVSTILFNANPLLRYDGYYILSDWLQIPNLRQRSVDYSMGLIKRHIFRVKASEPLPPPMQRIWLLSYAISSSIYRVFIGIMIIVLVAFKVPILGMLMAIGGVATWAVVPVVKVGKYLLIEPELHRKRGRAMLFCGAVAAAVIILVGLIRFPVHVDANGILEPGTRRVLTAGWDGFIQDIRVTDGQQVQKGQVLMVLANAELDSAIVQKRAELESWKARQTQSTMQDPAARTVYEPSFKAVKQQLDELVRRKGLLTITAPIAGRIVQPQLHYMNGLFLHQGQEVLTLAQTQDLLVRANIDQKDAGLVAQYHPTKAQVRLAGYLSEAPMEGRDLVFIDAAQEKLAHPSLGQAGGGDVQVDPRDPSGEKPLVQQFELRVRIDNPDGRFLPGQRSYVRCTLTNKPLIWQWTNRFWQLLMAENNGKWL
jgi:putative peptide zinc metalloprotease protein